MVGALRRRFGSLSRESAGQRESRIEQCHLILDQVYERIPIPPKYSVAHVVRYIKDKSAIYVARTSIGKQRNFTSTVGRAEIVIHEYMKNQGQEDERIDRLSMFGK